MSSEELTNTNTTTNETASSSSTQETIITSESMLTMENITITVRLIKNFHYRNIKLLVLKDIKVNEMTGNDLLKLVSEKIEKESGLLPHRGRKYDTFKLYHHAFSFKANNLVVNLQDDDKLIFQMDKTLKENNVDNEAEISCFIMDEYLEFKKNPELKW